MLGFTYYLFVGGSPPPPLQSPQGTPFIFSPVGGRRREVQPGKHPLWGAPALRPHSAKELSSASSCNAESSWARDQQKPGAGGSSLWISSFKSATVDRGSTSSSQGAGPDSFCSRILIFGSGVVVAASATATAVRQSCTIGAW